MIRTILALRARIPGFHLGLAVAVASVLTLMLVNWPGGASAEPGFTELGITNDDSPDSVAVGGTLTYTIQARNHGGADALDVVVKDRLFTSEVDFVSVTTTKGVCQYEPGTGQPATVTCYLDAVNAGSTVTVTVKVVPTRPKLITNVATVASPHDYTEGNNVAGVSTWVNTGASCASPSITGTSGNDVIRGTDRADAIVTLAGKDRVFAGGGADLVCTGGGADSVNGGGGSDTLIGGAGGDRLKGKGGSDLLKGKGGRDRLRGNAGRDLLNGGGGRDSCKGGAGRDTAKRCP